MTAIFAAGIAYCSTSVSRASRLFATTWRTVRSERTKRDGSGFPVRIVAMTTAAGNALCRLPA